MPQIAPQMNPMVQNTNADFLNIGKKIAGSMGGYQVPMAMGVVGPSYMSPFGGMGPPMGMMSPGFGMMGPGMGMMGGFGFW